MDGDFYCVYPLLGSFFSTMHHLCWTLFYSSCILFYSAFSSFEPFLQCISFARHFLHCIRSTGSNSVYHTHFWALSTVHHRYWALLYEYLSPLLGPFYCTCILTAGPFPPYPLCWATPTVIPTVYTVQHTLSRIYWMMALPKSTGSLSTELRYLRWASRQTKWALCTHTYHHTVQ